jgi:spore coat protein CotH
MNFKKANLLIVFLAVTVTTISCRKLIINASAQYLMSAFDLWEDRPPGIPCNQNISNATFESGELTFDNNHVFCVNIEMNENDFQLMREESRFGPNIYDNDGNTACGVLIQYADQCDVPFPNQYNWYTSNIEIDGNLVEGAGIRKKGFLGSIFSTAPSVKIETDKYPQNSNFNQTKSITLNNNSQNETRIWTSLALKIYELANYPAPLCNLANVTINSEPFGIYSHVETMDEKFLQREFGNSNGHLYEGQVIDFHKDWLPRWDAKTASTNEVGNPIKAICEDLELPDDKLLSALDQHLNIDNFITFWALEALLASSDGYCANRNNFFIYFDPNDNNRATFIPWGLDHYGWENSFEIYVIAELPRRLSRIEETATKFNNEMQRLLDDVWDETLFIGFINNASFLIESAQNDTEYQQKIDKLKSWIQNRKGIIESLLIDGVTTGSNEPLTSCTN